MVDGAGNPWSIQLSSHKGITDMDSNHSLLEILKTVPLFAGFTEDEYAKVVAAVFAAGGNAASGGVVSPRAFADLFELDEVLIGESFYNSAKPGQTATMARVWGKSALLFYRNPNATPRMGVTFGITAQFGTRIAGSRPDPDIGLRGGTRIRVGEGVKELITCSDAAYLFDAAVA